MPRLWAIVPLLCLTLAGIQANQIKLCGNDRRSQCVPHHMCDVGFEDGVPVLHYYTLQTGNQGCASTEACCPPNKILQENENNTWMNPSKQTDCGQANANGLTFTMRSAGGMAQEHELPWMTALLHRTGTYMGGGSLIALDVVLTASHVTSGYKTGDIIVRAGEWDLFVESEMFAHVDAGVRKIVRHPSFDNVTGANNLALLFLEKPFKASRHIRPICLPSKDQRFDRRQCIVSGWGKDAVAQNSYMNIMKKVDLPIVNFDTCEAQLQTHYGASYHLPDSVLCAGGEKGKDACKGDGGSPLACPIQNDATRFEQAGIVNWGIGCGQANTPAVYTDVAQFRTWIDKQIEEHSMRGLTIDDADEIQIVDDTENEVKSQHSQTWTERTTNTESQRLVIVRSK